MKLEKDQIAGVVFTALQQLKEYSELWEIHQADGFGCECDFCKLYESLNDDPEPDA